MLRNLSIWTAPSLQSLATWLVKSTLVHQKHLASTCRSKAFTLFYTTSNQFTCCKSKTQRITSMSHRISRFIEHLPEPDQEDISPASSLLANDLIAKTGGPRRTISPGYAGSRSSTQNSMSSLLHRLRGSFRLWLSQPRNRNR